MKSTSRALVAIALPFGLAIALVFVTPACPGSSSSTSGGGCSTNADCPNGTVCEPVPAPAGQLAGKCFPVRGSGGTAGSSGGGHGSTGGSHGGSSGGNNGTTGNQTGWTGGGSSSGGTTTVCLGWPNCGGTNSSSSGSGGTTCSCSTSCCSIDEGSAPSGTQCPGTTKYCYGVSDGGDFFCNLQNGKCDPFDPCSGASGTYTCQSSGTGGGSSGGSTGGAVMVDPEGLSFVMTGDTRPDSSGDPYPTAIVDAIYTDFTNLSPKPMVVVATGDYQEEGDSDPTSEIDDYESAIAIFAPSGPTFPAMGNHECVSTSITTSCAVSGANSSNNTSAFTAYMQMLTDLNNQYPTWFTTSTNGQPYYYETVTAPNGDTAKFVITAANAWDSTQVSWLTTTLAIPSTFTFLARHEPDTAVGCTDSTANDNTTSNCDFVAQVQTAINAAPVPVTLKLEGHTHWLHFDTGNDAIVSGAGGVSIESGCTASDTLYCNYGYVWCQELTNKTFQCTAYDYQSGEVISPAQNGYPAQLMQFIAANGSPNPGTLNYAN